MGTYIGVRSKLATKHLTAKIKGAIIKGNIEPNTTVKISVPIRTNIGRRFVYSQTTESDYKGDYQFVVPYSIGKPIPEGTQFDVIPTEPYKVTYGNITVNVPVSETAVLNGDRVVLI